jgi:hypothetical protein
MFLTQASPRLSVAIGIAILACDAYVIYRLEKQYVANLGARQPESGDNPQS